MDFEELVKENLLTITPSGYVRVKPQDRYSFTTFPVDEYDCILLTPEEYVGLLDNTYMFDEHLKGVVKYVDPYFAENALTNEEE
jgi:hypothetical protein